MNTDQLLLVSGLGLAINLFGLYATGGHHHHGVSTVWPLSRQACLTISLM